MDGARIKPPVIQLYHSLFSIFLITEFDIDIAHKVVTQVVADVHLFDFSILVLHLSENFFKEVIKDLLGLHIGHLNVRAISCLTRVLRVDVQVL